MVGSPTFRSTAINAVAVIPLLSRSNDGLDDPTTHSSQSFDDFLSTLHRHNANNANHQGSINRSVSTNNNKNNNNNSSNVVVVVPYSNLTPQRLEGDAPSKLPLGTRLPTDPLL